jgi:Undecaprenyl-phosphate galactose phosphotransferase WbaP
MLADLLSWGLSFAIMANGQLPTLNLIGLWLIWSLVIHRQYFRRTSFWTELLSIIRSTSIFMALGCISGLLVGNIQVWQIYISWGLALAALLPIMRAIARKVLRLFSVWDRSAVIFGAGENAHQAALAFRSEPSIGYALKSFVIPSGQQTFLTDFAEHKTWPIKAEDFEWLRQHQCVVALEASQSELRDQLLRQLSQHNIKRVSVIPAMRGVPLFGLDTTQFFSHEVLMIHVRNQLSKPVLRAMKRVFDVVGASLLLLVLSPLFAYLAYKISRDGGSAFFGHERVGQNGKKFKCYKFRSMVVKAQEVLKELLARDEQARTEWDKNFKLKNDPRINPIGHFLRRSSLDELPQLWNVLMGDMSLVGPRPVVQAELERYGDDVVYYLMAKPGMTGLWQVSGRNDVDYDTRVYFDAWYVKNWSLWTDIAILFKTISVVTGRNGAY